MIEFHCKQCNNRLLIREDDTGKRVRCPHCGIIADYRAGAVGEADTVWHPSSGQATPDPSPAAGDTSDRWSMQTPDGDVYGPVPRAELDQWETEGRISAACLIQRDGQLHWQSALVLYPHLTAPQPRSGRPEHDRIGHAPGRPAGSSGPRPNNGPAVLAMGVVGIIMIGFPVFAMIAWAMGSSEIKAIQRGEAATHQRALVDIGYYLGIAGTVIGLLTWLGCCVLIRG